MFELTGKLKDLSINYMTDKCTLTLAINETNELTKCFEQLNECDKVSILIDKYREQRSQNANKYMWTLCTKLADKLSNSGVKHTKEDVYRNAIKEIGVWQDDEIEPDKVKWRCAAWEQIGIGWLTERVDFSADGSKEVIRFYYGSSRYNSNQMHKLINNIVQDCEAMDIPTITPDEIANLISLWETERKK